MADAARIENPEIDHLVLDVGDRIDQAEAAYRLLGFNLSPRGRHSLGSENHVAALRGPYLELLGLGSAGRSRPELAGSPIGLNGIVLASQSPSSTFEALRALGIRAQQPTALSRPVDPRRTARFSVVRLEADQTDFGRVYFCHHETPELIWNDDSLAHPNGAIAIVRARIATNDARKATQFLMRIFGENILQRDSSCWRLRFGAVDLDFVPPREAEWWATAEGRDDYIAVLTMLTSSLRQTAEVLRSNGITGVIFEAERIVVPATVAFNLALEFVQA